MHCGTSFMVKSRDRVAHSQDSAILIRNAVFLVTSVSAGHLDSSQRDVVFETSAKTLPQQLHPFTSRLCVST